LLQFIHIPRTGGTSITTALKAALGYTTNLPEDLHWSVDKRVVNNKWNDREFSFTFIRNPWDRLVSWYFWHKIEDDFESWIKNGLDGVKNHNWFNATSNPLFQENWFIDKKRLSFVGKFESLSRDLCVIEDVYGVKLEIDHIHKTIHDQYQNYYTPETKDIVAKKFSWFIKEFEYDF
jgi:hypothetical protein